MTYLSCLEAREVLKRFGLHGESLRGAYSPRLQFTLRSLLLAVTGATLYFAAVGESRLRQRNSAARIEKLGGTYAWGGRSINDVEGSWNRREGRANRLTFLWISGMWPIENVDLSMTRCGDNDLRLLQGLPQTESLFLDSTPITDRGVKWIATLPRLRVLSIIETEISDAGISELLTAPSLSHLHCGNIFRGDLVTDAALTELAKHTALEVLTLEGAGVTDAGITQLKSLANLKQLYLLDTRVSKEGVSRLTTALPRCEIMIGSR